jgi:ANTAR domain
VVVGDQLLDGAGRVVGTTGFYVDLTEHFAADVQRSVTEAVAAVEERRDLVQQATGIVGMAYGVSAECAFDVLKWRSQQLNVKLRVIAARIVDELVAYPPAAEVRSHIDHVLLTAHERSATAPVEPFVDGQA